MKLRFFKGAVPIIIGILAAGCFQTTGDTTKSEVSVTKNSSVVTVKASNEFISGEFVLNGNISGDSVVAGKDSLKIVRNENGNTLIVLAKTTGVFKVGEPVFSINGNGEVLSEKVVKESDLLSNSKVGKRGYVERLLGDFNTDNIVDITDFLTFVRNYGKKAMVNGIPQFDYNGNFDIAPLTAGAKPVWEDKYSIHSVASPDGSVDILDFTIFAQNYAKKSPYYNVDLTAKNLNADIGKRTTIFGTKVFSKILQEKSEANKNIFISPLSLSSALTMVYNGAKGATKDEMTQAMEYNGLDINSVNINYQALQNSLESVDDTVTLNIANSLWISKNYTVQPTFIDTCKTYFDAEARNIDYKLPTSGDEINKWASDKTNAKIEKIVPGSTDPMPIDPNTIMVLVNALYFKGDWKDKFDPTLTKDGTFTTDKNEIVTVPMMKAYRDIYCSAKDDYLGIRLPYGRDKLAMYVFMPNDSANIDTLAEKIDFDTLGMSTSKLNIALPKFKITYTKELKSVLQVLGMKTAFEDNADFSGMVAYSKISSVLQKTFIDVNEAGSEAAAVTAVTMMPTSVMPKDVIFNKPFIFYIRDDRTGTVLFMGKIVNPLI